MTAADFRRYRRVRPGEYHSSDGRVIIARVISRQTRRPDEICWSVNVDGRVLPRSYGTKREAKAAAARKLESGTVGT